VQELIGEQEKAAWFERGEKIPQGALVALIVDDMEEDVEGRHGSIAAARRTLLATQ